MYIPLAIFALLGKLCWKFVDALCCSDIGGAPTPEEYKTSCTTCSVTGYNAYQSVKKLLSSLSVVHFLNLLRKRASLTGIHLNSGDL
eukprot:TRINITY_DN16094_c0_g1_i1.p1 TRINITY_DN16094_c0_g1~~TRINITY_DN16094_c0_g1_i1.p1  ORF type:complete len:87 (+),score=4.61 TRINITY_DN16094_c0_g1_i1:83-343(+)